MQQNGWRARAAKKFKATTNSNHRLPVAPNLLEQDFSAQKPNEKWVSDITYGWTDEGWLYLAVVMDLYSTHGSWLGYFRKDDCPIGNRCLTNGFMAS